MTKTQLKHIFLLGLGISGMSLALHLKKKGVSCFCWDDDLKIRETALERRIALEDVSEKILRKCNLLVLSPGINHQKLHPHKAVKIANSLKIKIITDLEFLNILEYKNTLVGVTGTNGKSTTTHFMEKIISNKNNFNVKACGNIGIPFTNLKIKRNTILIVESSSFQLAKIDKLKFNHAFLLNISEDHIEWHGSMENYIKAKMRIFKNQDSNCNAIICVDDKYTQKIAKSFKEKFNSNLISISCNINKNVDIFLKITECSIIIVNKIAAEKLTIPLNLINFTIAKHNLQNLLATYVFSFLLNQNKKEFLDSLKNLTNLAHRIEYIGKNKNIFFYNDSKSTNVSSAKTALESFNNIFWILGGRAKKGGLRGIEKSLDNVIRAYIFGESAQDLNDFLKKQSIKCCIFNSLEESLDKVLEDTKDIFNKDLNILFSPACASFDQFKNFEHRGDIFKKLVSKKLKKYG